MKKMKRIYTITTIIMTALALAGCAKELEENVQKPDEPQTDGETMILGAVLPDSPDTSDSADAAAQSADTKTTIERYENDGKVAYSVLWAEGDAISVNGKTSKNMNIDPDNAKNATFTLDVVDAPYCAVYPAGAASGYAVATPASGNKGEEGYVATVPAQVTVTVPATQKYVANDIDQNAAIMYAYSESATEPLQFKHAMAYLKLTVEGAAIKTVKVNGNHNEMMSGDFVLSYNTAENVFVAKNEANKDKPKGNASVKYECGDAGVAAGTPMFVAIPAALYDTGLTLTLIDTDNHYQVVKSTLAFLAESGKVYTTKITFESKGDYDYKGIYTVEDWNNFILDLNAGKVSNWVTTIGSDTGIHIMENIECQTNLEASNTVVSLQNIVYGHGHTITHHPVRPMFTFIGENGGISDLTIAGNNIIDNVAKWDNNKWPGVFALENSGRISNCVSSVEMTLSGSMTNAAGICRTNKGTIVGCKNMGGITISKPKEAVNVAGIAFASTGTIKDCTNKGKIIVGDESGSESGGINQDCIAAGVVLRACGTTENLVNEADISINANLSEMRTIYLGGVIANTETEEDKLLKTTAGTAKMIKSCKNYGCLSIIKRGKYQMRGGAIGGVAASVNTGTGTSDCSIFDSCTNSGNISFYETETYLNSAKIPTGAYAVGGILGRCVALADDLDANKKVLGTYYKLAAGCYTVVRVNCVNTGNIDVCVANGQPMKDGNSGARQTYVGGIAGFVGGGVVRGNKGLTTPYTIKLGSLYGGICAGGILGGSYSTKIDGDSIANVNFAKSDNEFLTPEKIGYVGAVLGWATSSLNASIAATVATANIGFDSTFKDTGNYASGFAGIKSGATITIVSTCKYNGKAVTADDIYGGTMKQ